MPCMPWGEVLKYLYSFITTVLDGGGCSMPCPGLFTPSRKPQYPLYRRPGGPQNQSRWVWNKETLLCLPSSNPEMSSLHKAAKPITLSQPSQQLLNTDKMFNATLEQCCQHNCCCKSHDMTKPQIFYQQILWFKVTFYWLFAFRFNFIDRNSTNLWCQFSDLNTMVKELTLCSSNMHTIYW
jgi:hypothetical protein